jgi:hypothetical protein
LDLSQKQQDEVYDIWKAYYNGYLFSPDADMKVFNSTLIMYYLQKFLPLKRHPKNLVDANLNQSPKVINGIVNIKNKESNLDLLEELVKSRSVRGNLSPYLDLARKFDKNDFLTLLYHIGFLTIKEAGAFTIFEMPNKIIESIYFEYLSELVQLRYDYGIDVSAQEEAVIELLEHGKIDALTMLVQNFLSHISLRNAINFDEQDIKLSFLRFLFPTNQFYVYDEFPAGPGFTDLILMKTANSYSKYEYLIELKHVKKGRDDSKTEAEVQLKYQEALTQLNAYMKDQRLASRAMLKKFVVVFKGF